MSAQPLWPQLTSDSVPLMSPQYALLIASLCHDMGHPGKTNNFLIATRADVERNAAALLV